MEEWVQQVILTVYRVDIEFQLVIYPITTHQHQTEVQEIALGHTQVCIALNFRGRYFAERAQFC